MSTELFCSRVLIRQHKAQMKRKSREIQEALVRVITIVRREIHVHTFGEKVVFITGGGGGGGGRRSGCFL